MIIGYFGKPRSGKTTALARYLCKCLKTMKRAQLPVIGILWRWSKYNKSVIYSTELMPGTVMIRPYDIGTFEPPERSLFIIHEAGCDFNNRNYKTIPQHCTDFFAQHGHYKVDIIYDSQTVDIDKKLRNRTQYFWIVKKVGLVGQKSKMHRIKYWIGVNNDSKTLDECYAEPKGIFERLFYLITRQTVTFKRKPYYVYFDSYSHNLKFNSLDPAQRDEYHLVNPYKWWHHAKYVLLDLIKLLVIVIWGLTAYYIFFVQ